LYTASLIAAIVMTLSVLEGHSPTANLFSSAMFLRVELGIASYVSKDANFNLPHMYSAPLLR